MANTYKNIVITPNRDTAANVVPQIQFSGGDSTTNTDITLKVYTASNGTLSIEGSAGQLFSVTNDLSNSIFSVNDISGIPSIDVSANGDIGIVPYGGNVYLGYPATVITTGANKLEVYNGTLGTTAGSYSNIFSAIVTDNNLDRLGISAVRGSTGNDWTTANIRLARIVDSTPMGYMKFGNFNTDLITFGVNNTEYMRIYGNGQVMIGNTTPSSVQGLTLNSPYNYFGIALQVAGNTESNIIQESTGFLYVSAGIKTNTGGIVFRTRGATERMRIDSSGNVGIGTTSATHRVHVNGSVRANGEFVPGTVAWTNGAFTGNGSYGGAISLVDGTAGYGLYCINSGADFTIGQGSITGGLTSRLNISGASGLIGINTSPISGYTLTTNGKAYFNAGTDFTPDASWSGHLNIGGNGYAGGISLDATGMWIGHNSTSRVLILATNETERMRISATGNVSFTNLYGVTVTTPRNVFVDASGNIGGISSVRESKTNIQYIPDASWLMNLNPVTFNYRKKDENGNYTDEYDEEIVYGLIAEEVAEVNPDLCIYNNGELASIHYDRMIAPLIRGFQELKTELDTVKAELQALKSINT